MCYNCGCGRTNDDMNLGHAGVDSNGKSITDQTFKAAGESMKMTQEEAMANTLESLKKVLNKNTT